MAGFWLSHQIGNGMSSSQLTLTHSIIFQRGRLKAPTRLDMVEMTQQLIQTPGMFEYFHSISTVFRSEFFGSFLARTGRLGRELTARIPMSFHRISGTLERLERFRPQVVPSKKHIRILGTTEILLQWIFATQNWNLHDARVSCRGLTLTNTSMRKTLHERRLFPGKPWLSRSVLVCPREWFFWLLQEWFATCADRSYSPKRSRSNFGMLWLCPMSHWIGLRENLQETMVFTIKLIGLSCKFSHNPILWMSNTTGSTPKNCRDFPGRCRAWEVTPILRSSRRGCLVFFVPKGGN